MTGIDIAIVLAYFMVVIGIGFVFRRRASQDLESYFLGGKRLHWLALAMSGSVSNFDITGTMWMVSILFILGMKSIWHHWMWGFLMGAFFLSYMGKWVRRSNVLTAAEWMKTRFGEGKPGRLARTSYAVMAILTQASFVGYAFQGIGKFAAVVIPLETYAGNCRIEWLRSLLINHESAFLASLIIALTTLYIVLGGLFSVVVTDVIQTFILSISGILIAVIAWTHWGKFPGEAPEQFTSLQVPWRIPEFAGTEHAGFELFGALVIVWIIKGLLMNAGGPAQMYDFQRFLAAKSERDAAKIGAAWSGFLVVRWAMVMGIVLLALSGLSGITDSEKVMPLVLQNHLPAGFRGIVIAGLLAAFMSTFSSTVNSGASFMVRDIWQVYLRPKANESQAVKAGYLSTVLIVVIGLIIGSQSRSIGQIWNWMMMALGAGIIVPNVMRWYWWRMNGWGYAWGMLAGLTMSFLALFLRVPDYYLFPLIVFCSAFAGIAGSLFTRPVDRTTLLEFYNSVRPFGIWGPVKKLAGEHIRIRVSGSENPGRTILNTLLGMLAIWSLYLSPMYLVGHWNGPGLFWLALGISAVIVLKFTWYDALPVSKPVGEKET